MTSARLLSRDSGSLWRRRGEEARGTCLSSAARASSVAARPGLGGGPRLCQAAEQVAGKPGDGQASPGRTPHGADPAARPLCKSMAALWLVSLQSPRHFRCPVATLSALLHVAGFFCPPQRLPGPFDPTRVGLHCNFVCLFVCVLVVSIPGHNRFWGVTGCLPSSILDAHTQALTVSHPVHADTGRVFGRWFDPCVVTVSVTVDAAPPSMPGLPRLPARPSHCCHGHRVSEPVVT